MCVSMRVLAGRLAGRVRLEKFERKGNEGIIMVVNCKKAIVAKIIHLLRGNKTIYTLQEENSIYKYVDL